MRASPLPPWASWRQMRWSEIARLTACVQKRTDTQGFDACRPRMQAPCHSRRRLLVLFTGHERARRLPRRHQRQPYWCRRRGAVGTGGGGRRRSRLHRLSLSARRLRQVAAQRCRGCDGERDGCRRLVVEGGVSEGEWSRRLGRLASRHVPCACATFPKRAARPLLAGIQSSHRSWRCQRGIQMSYVSQKCHPLRHYGINSKKPVSKPVLESQPI
jgi:hypothetical protein